MWIIILSIIVFSITAITNEKNKKIAICAYIAFGIIYCFRGSVASTDWSTYEYYFNNVNDAEITKVASFEPGYYWISKIIHDIGLPYWFLRFIISVFTVVLFYFAIKQYTDNYGIAFLLGTYYFFYPSYEISRQIITLSIFIYSLKYLENDWKKYWLLNLIGILFHRTSVIALLFFFFYKNKWCRCIISGSIVFFTTLQPLVEKVLTLFPGLLMKYQWYFKYKAEYCPGLLSFKGLEYLICTLYILLLYMGIKYSNKTENYKISKLFDFKSNISAYENISNKLVFFGLLVQTFIGRITSYTYRIMYFCDIGLMLEYCYFYGRIKEKKLKRVYTFIMILYVSLRLFRIVYANIDVFK